MTTFTAEHREKLSQAKRGKRQEHLYTPEVREKIAAKQRGSTRPSAQGENHHAWKGDDAGYGALHNWVRRKLGTPQICQRCHTLTAQKYEWANISGKYLRVLWDWVRLCTKCHRWLDNQKKKV